MFSRIMVYLDGSKLAEGILPYVIEQAKSFSSKVFLLKVNTFSQLSASSAMPGMVSVGASAGWANKLEELETKAYLDQMAHELSDKGLNVEAIMTTGPVIAIILKCIKDNAIDMVAMTAQAYKGWKRLFLGSINWEVLYSQYKWLCKVKHPTIPSALHDAFSVSLTGSEYIVMGAPDTRAEDLPSKAFILSVTILRVTEAIRSFALARRLDFEKRNVVSWQNRLDSIATNLDTAVDPLMKMPLPFTYDGRMF